MIYYNINLNPIIDTKIFLYICTMPYSLNDTFNNLNINDLIDKFFNRNEFRLEDIILFYTSKDSDIKKITIQWRVTRLLELGVIQRIGRGKYAMGKYQKFIPYPTLQTKKIHRLLISEFPEAKFCLWSTEWIKSYLPDLDVQITFVEGIGIQSSQFFMYLWEQKDGVVFYGLPTKTSKKFSKNIVVVRKMISGSPLVESNEIVYPHLEKMIVDLYCDWTKIYTYKNPTFYKFFKKLHSNFSINESKLLRYADRRKRKEFFLKCMQRLKRLNS